MNLSPSKRLVLPLAVLLALIALWPLRSRLRAHLAVGVRKVQAVRGKTIEDRLNEFGTAARARWKPHFEKAGVSYPPSRVVLVGLKDVNQLGVYASNEHKDLAWVRRIRIKAASGDTGPKLREGDLQVPEGIYPIELLNPNSLFHVSLRVGYPNAFDRQRAKSEGRTNLGGDIMIHGGAASVGCIAVGDEAAEDLFVLAADVGIKNLKVLLCPSDLRTKPVPEAGRPLPSWYPELIKQLKQELVSLPPLQAASWAPLANQPQIANQIRHGTAQLFSR